MIIFTLPEAIMVLSNHNINHYNDIRFKNITTREELFRHKGYLMTTYYGIDECHWKKYEVCFDTADIREWELITLKEN